MRRLAAGLLLVASCGACQAAGDGGAELAVATAPVAVQSEDAEPAPCRVVFSPDPVLEAATVRAAARWSAATGCSVEVGAPGVWIELVDHVWRPDGTDAPGATSPERDHVRINTRARAAQRDRTLLHEVGHVLGMTSEHAVDDVIDSVALSEVCSVLACSVFIPEAP
jgi:hypothetical protein